MDQDYQYEAFDEAMSLMANATRQVTDAVDNVGQQTTQLLGSFDAASSKTYGDKSKTLQQQLTNLSMQLDRLSKTTGEGADDMRQADQKSAALFG